MLNNINAAYAKTCPTHNSSGLGPLQPTPSLPNSAAKREKRDQVNFSQDGAATRKLAYPD